MSYCPHCDFVYNVDIARCPDCRSMLIKGTDAIHRSAEKPDDSWIVIGDIGDESTIELVQGTLESSNIPALFVDLKEDDDSSHLAWLLNDHQVEPNRSVVIVPKEYKKEAVFLLSELLEISENKFRNREAR